MICCVSLSGRYASASCRCWDGQCWSKLVDGNGMPCSGWLDITLIVCILVVSCTDDDDDND